MAKKPIGIALLGCGVVGSGVIKLLHDQAQVFQKRAGVSFEVRHVVVRDPSKARDLPVKVNITTDASAAIADPEVQIVVELIGGTGIAADLIQQALKLGKPVVTANKSLLATRGPEFFALARKHNATIGFEASCGGGIPIIDALTRGLMSNQIHALTGIINGTCNVILTRMTRNGWTYAQALEEAQKLGFAEADPTLDVSGRDAGQKLALLASLAFQYQIAEKDVYTEGVDTLQPTDIQLAGELGYVIKLLAIAEQYPADSSGKPAISLRVHPALVHHDEPLAEISGSFNAISIYGHALGHAMFSGRGAGQMPTASAVVADILQIALGSTALTFKQLQIYPDTTSPAHILPIEDIHSRYYLRVTAKDYPGVMARVSTILSQQEISLSAILQKEVDPQQTVPVVITTHRAREGAMRSAIARIDAMSDIIVAPTVCLRIADEPEEFGGKK